MSESATLPGVLDGVRVLEIGHFVAKPWDNRVLIEEIRTRSHRALKQRDPGVGKTLPAGGETPPP